MTNTEHFIAGERAGNDFLERLALIGLSIPDRKAVIDLGKIITGSIAMALECADDMKKTTEAIMALLDHLNEMAKK